MKPYSLVALVGLVAASPVAAQWSSDIPGTPRAAISFAGSRQSRIEFQALYFRFPAADGRDTLAIGMSIGWGRSFRIAGQFEAGFDITITEGMHVRQPSDDENEDLPSYTRGLAAYGFRLGGKFTPIRSVSPAGYGYHAGVAIAFEPGLQPAFGVKVEGDSTTTGGAFIGDEDGIDPVTNALPWSLRFAALGSYRARRFMVDGGLVLERTQTQEAGEPLFPTYRYSGLSPRLGAMLRLTSGISAGFSWWADGSPPWHHRIIRPGPAESESNAAIVISFGSRMENGTDFVLMSPRGSFSEAVRLYIRSRATF